MAAVTAVAGYHIPGTGVKKPAPVTDVFLIFLENQRTRRPVDRVRSMSRFFDKTVFGTERTSSDHLFSAPDAPSKETCFTNLSFGRNNDVHDFLRAIACLLHNADDIPSRRTCEPQQ